MDELDSRRFEVMSVSAPRIVLNCGSFYLHSKLWGESAGLVSPPFPVVFPFTLTAA